MKTKRKICIGCGFIEVRCLCQFIKKVRNKTKIIILQHPSEIKHAIGTLQILRKSLDKITVYEGEKFDDNKELIELSQNEKETTALVFPKTEEDHLNTISITQFKNIILIDGSWRKARKILFMNPWLNQLPKISLVDSKTSQYKIRKSSQKNSLSTLEAVVECLNQIEPNLDTHSLMKTFNAMIDFQIEKMGAEKYQTNYKKGDE
jgi:DTW domain-containing protein YfiP